MSTFALPDLGEGLQEAEIVAWHVNPGDHVVADQPLVSVETEKAVVEIPSPVSGHIARLCAALGDRIRVGAPLVEFEEGVRPDVGAVVGELKSTAVPSVKASPAVRAHARTIGVDLATVTPSGPSHSVTIADVDKAAAQRAAHEALRGVRRAMAANMTRAGAEIVPATIVDDADVEHWPADTDITARLVRAIVAGCAAMPIINAQFEGRTLQLTPQTRIDLGLAVDTDDGLLVPVLRDVGSRDVDDLRGLIQSVKRQAQARTLPLETLRGATITLSNFGTMAGRYASLVVVPPQVAILGAGCIAARVVAVDGRPAVRRMLPLSLTFDHRAITGGEAARFLRVVIADMQGTE